MTSMGKYGKIAVFAGGISNEREISLKSGKAVHEALKRKKENAELIDVGEGLKGRLKRLDADVVFIALHGKFGEDGCVQALLEEEGIPYTGSGVTASRLALDKLASREIFLENSLRVPAYKIAKKDSVMGAILGGFKTPFVVKPQREGSSMGLSIVSDKVHAATAFDMAFGYGDTAVVEEYIHGRELTVGIMEEQALPVIEIITRHNVYDYDAKYVDDGTRYVVPATLEKDIAGKVQEAALRAHKSLGCRDFSRVDMRMDGDGNIYVLEVNTIPGLTKRSLLPKAAQAAGVDFDELCMRLVNLAHGRK